MTKHIIVDGSNIATEGRAAPSLAQLNDAVLALMKEFPGAKVSVVVDATFGHRIARKEVAEFNKAVEHNELVTPPAGAVGRGDAFVLAIAEKVNGSVLSNDSYQEFHDTHKWLFDPGRLIGGKPVPHVGWVFVARVPVRAGKNGRAVKSIKSVATAARQSPESTKPMPVPRTPPPGARERHADVRVSNDVVDFLQFVENHPVGAKVRATVATYAANGMSVKIGDVTGYVPLKAISIPPPRSAREVYRIGDSVQLVITGYTPARRSVDLGAPGVVAPAAPKRAPVAKKTVAPKKASAPKKTTSPKKAATVKKKAVAPKKAGAPRAAVAPRKSAAGSTGRRAASVKSTARSATANSAGSTARSTASSKSTAVRKKAPAQRSSGARKKTSGASRR